MPIAEWKITAGANDGFWLTSVFDNTDTTLYIGRSVGSIYKNFLLFNIRIPDNATITAAYLQFGLAIVSGTPEPVTIYAEDAANPSVITGIVDGDGRTTTTANVSWTPPTAGTLINTPDISTIISELRTSYNYNSFSNIQIIVIGSGIAANNYIRVRSFESSVSLPTLHIEFTTPDPASGHYGGLEYWDGAPLDLDTDGGFESGWDGAPSLPLLYLATYTISAESGAFALAGQAPTLKASRILPAGSGDFALAGQAPTLKASRAILAGSGSFSLAGQAPTLLASRLISCGNGAFALVGQDVTLVYTSLNFYVMECESGSFSLEGQAPTLKASRILPAGSGDFVLAGQALTLKASRILPAASGAFDLAGQAPTLEASRVLPAGSGSFDLAGQALTLKTSRVLPAGSGAFDLAGQDVSLLSNRVMICTLGAFLLAGQDASLQTSRLLSAGSGAFILAGQDVQLVFTPLCIFKGRIIGMIGSGIPKSRLIGGI